MNRLPDQKVRSCFCWIARLLIGFSLTLTLIHYFTSLQSWSLSRQLLIVICLAVGFTWLADWLIKKLATPRLITLSDQSRLLWISGAVLIGGLLLVALSSYIPPIPMWQTLEIQATGQKNPQAQGTEVWLISLQQPDNLIIPNSEIQLTGEWELRDGMLVSYQNQPAVARWRGFITGDLTLTLVSHPWSGVVNLQWDDRVQQLDLYSETSTQRVIILPWIGSRLNFSTAIVYTAYFISLGTLVFFFLPVSILLRRTAAVYIRESSPPFYLSTLIFIIPFVMSRLWFFQDYPLPLLMPDSVGYYRAAEAIGSDNWPSFGIRPPGYPALLKLIFLFSDKLRSLLIVQNLLSLATGLFIIYSVHRIDRRLSPWAALAMAVFVSSGKHLDYDTALLSESLYTNCLVSVFAFLLLGLATNKSIFYGLTSAGMAAVILVRPAGLFLVVVYLLILAFLLWNNYTHKTVLSFSLPMPCILLMLCLYNYLTLGVFAITVWGEANLSGATITFWEQDETFPTNINAVIGQVQKAMRQEDRAMLYTSWQLNELYTIFERNYNPLLHTIVLHQLVDDYSDNEFRDSQQILRNIALTSIKKHPHLYLKFVLSNLWQYHIANLKHDSPPYSMIQGRAIMIYRDRFKFPDLSSSLSFMAAKEYANLLQLSGVTIQDDSEITNVALTLTPAFSLYTNFLSLRTALFNQFIWGIAYCLIFGLSIFMLLYRRGRHKGAFILFILTTGAFGASLVVCLVEVALPRYSYPAEFIVYLSVALLPLMFVREDPG